MAKSKKALKALKRRKAAKGRSRVLKERQDYTGGGRVKAFTGFPGNISIPNQEEIKRRVEAYEKSLVEDASGDTTENVATSNAEGSPPATSTPATGTPATGTPATGTPATGTPATGVPPTPLTSEQDAAAKEAAELEARREILRRNGTIGMDTDGDGRLSDAEKYKAATGVDMPPRGEQPPTDTSEQDAAAEAAAQAERDRLAAEQAAARAKTGTTAVDQVDFATSPFNYDSLNITADTEVRNIRVNDGTGNVIVPVPFGALSTQQQNALKSIRQAYPDETERAVEAYKYLNSAVGLKEPPEDTEEEDLFEVPEDAQPPVQEGVPYPGEDENPPYEETRERPLVTNDVLAEIDPEIQKLRKYTRGYINLEALNFSGEERKIYNFNFNNWSKKNPEPEKFRTSGTATDFGNIPAQGQKTTSEWGSWNYKRLQKHNQIIDQIMKLPRYWDGKIKPVKPIKFAEKTVAPYRVPGLDADPVEKADVAQVGTGEETRGRTFQIDQYRRNSDGSLMFDSEGNLIPVDIKVAELTDEEKVGTGKIGVDTVTDEEKSKAFTSAVKTAAEDLGVEAPAIEAYTAAEANYFRKYPEVRDAINQGEADDIFDYQRRIGAEKGYTLDFDVSKYADGTVDRLGEAFRAELQKTQAAERDAQQEREALGTRPEFSEDLRSQVDQVTGERVTLTVSPEAERQQRQAITDEEAAVGTEAIIQGSVGYEAAERRQVKGEAAQGAAVSMLSQVGQLPTEISEAILDNPAQVTAQIDNNPVEVQAAIAALPQEALVSVQLENLLAGIDEGVTPSWARPAVQAVESRLNARGLSVSTVGRDALFNAIIQTALPIAQSNATALQQRANQNLSNEQQANLQQSSQDMQLRLTNLANRQGAETQSAQLAQQINLTQGQFTQQAQMTEAEQRQQVRLQSLQNEQQAAMANLGNDQQIELANLQIEAERLGANQNATNQERLAEMQVAANFLQKNSEFKQQMEVANLSNEQQMRLAFLTAKNQAESENLSAAQQTELANLNNRLQVNKISADLAQQMNLAQLNVDQQRAVQNAATVANIDLTKFSAAQQVELTNSKFMQTSTLQDLNNRQQAVIRDATSLAGMDLAAVDAKTKVSVENARNFLAMNMANLTNEQQAYMLDSQQRQQVMLSDISTQNAARQFNATSDLQTQQYVTSLSAQLEQFNSQQFNALEQFNASEANRAAALDAGNELQAEQFMAQIQTQIRQFNSQQDLQVEQFNVANAQAVEQSNVEWRRKANLADTAATNAANQQQAAFQFDLNKTSLAQAWQSLRDQANFDFQEYQTDKERKISAINAILSNEAFMTEDVYAGERLKLFKAMDFFTTSIRDIRDTGVLEIPDYLQE